MNICNFIKELQSISGLEEIKPNNEGIYALRINDIRLVYFSESPDKENLFIYSSLCQIPPHEDEKLILFEQLLIANLFGKETGNSYFALDHHSHQLLLICRIPMLQLSKEMFFKELQQFISSLSHWEEIRKNFAHKHRKEIRKSEIELQKHHIKI